MVDDDVCPPHYLVVLHGIPRYCQYSKNLFPFDTDIPCLIYFTHGKELQASVEKHSSSISVPSVNPKRRLDRLAASCPWLSRASPHHPISLFAPLHTYLNFSNQISMYRSLVTYAFSTSRSTSLQKVRTLLSSILIE